MSPLPTAPPTVGDQVGPYLLEAAIGSGGLATVYRGTGPRGAVAVKILHSSRVTPHEVKRLKREHKTLARLSHPGIVGVIESGDHYGVPWLALELVEGCDLGAIVARWQHAPPADRWQECERMLVEMCEALQYVHERGIVHRDLKPANVLVSVHGRTRLTDFGVVKDSDAFTTNLTMAGRLVGTVAYMAPEQITGDPVDARADLYSLGAVLYTMLTGRRPIIAESIAQYLARHLGEMPRPPSELDPGVPPRLERVCMRLLQKDRARRFGSAAEVLLALQAGEAASALPIHGRDRELMRLATLLDGLKERREGAALVLGGPAGAGRSRLLLELLGRADALGLGAVGVRPGQGLGKLIAEAEGDPWVLAVDDAHGLDSEERAALTGLLHRRVSEGLPVAIVLSIPDGAGHPQVAADLAAVGAEDLALGKLDGSALRGLLRDLGARGGLGAMIARRLEELGASLPGDAVAQVGALVDAGWLARAPDGSLRAKASQEALRGSPLPLPAAVRVAESRAVAELRPAERACLEALAVLEVPASLALAGPVAQAAGAPAAADTLASLAHRGVVAVETDGLREMFSLPPGRRGQVLVEAMAPDRASRLHRAAADALVAAYGRRLGEIAESVAHHRVLSGQEGAAYPLLVVAAQRAARRGDVAAARTLATRAQSYRSAGEATLAPTEAATQRLRLALVLGDALRAEGRTDAALDAYAQAMGAAIEADDPQGRARAAAGHGLCSHALALPAALPSLREALGTLPRGEPTWPVAVHALVEALVEVGRIAEAEATAARLQEHAADTGDEAELAMAAHARAVLARQPGKVATGELAEATRHARTADAEDVLARCLVMAGEAAVLAGDVARMRELATELDAMGERGALGVLDASGQALRAVAAETEGDAAAAHALAGEALALARARGGPRGFAGVGKETWVRVGRLAGG